MQTSPVTPSSRQKQLYRRLTWSDLDTRYLEQLISCAKDEDLEGCGLADVPKTPGDCTTRSLGHDKPGKAHLVARQPMAVCGQKLAPMILKAYGKAQYTAHCADGDLIETGQHLGTVTGQASEILQAERILLNFLQRLCGVATCTRSYVDTMGKTTTRLLDTRKTTPGLRALEKYAVACGGGWNHRMGLYDRVMLKDNHLAASGAAEGSSLAEAAKRAKAKNPDLLIEVEVDSMAQIPPVLEAGADIIMLDNFSLPELKEAITLIGDRAYTEASGGITLDTLAELSQLGLDFISTGATIHQSPWLDIGLDWHP